MTKGRVGEPAMPANASILVPGQPGVTEQAIATSEPKYVTIGYNSVEWPVSIVAGAIAPPPAG